MISVLFYIKYTNAKLVITRVKLAYQEQMEWKLLEMKTKNSHGSWPSLLEFLYSIIPPWNPDSSAVPPCCSPCLCGLTYCPKLKFYHSYHLLHGVFSDLLQGPVTALGSFVFLFVLWHFILPWLWYMLILSRPFHATHTPPWNPCLHLLYLANTQLVSSIYEMNSEKKKTPNTQLLPISTLIARATGKNKMGIWGQSPRCSVLALALMVSPGHQFVLQEELKVCNFIIVSLRVSSNLTSRIFLSISVAGTVFFLFFLVCYYLKMCKFLAAVWIK